MFECRDKPGKNLARLLAESVEQSKIIKIKSNLILTSQLEEKLEIFVNDYNGLCSADPPDRKGMDDFFTLLTIPQLELEHSGF